MLEALRAVYQAVVSGAAMPAPRSEPRLEPLGHSDEFGEHRLVANPVGDRQQGGRAQDGAGFGPDGAGGGLEDTVVGGARGIVFDFDDGEGVDVLVEGDLGLAIG